MPPDARSQTAHRPWPLPEGRWSLFMRWADLAFLHWPVPAEVLRPLIPESLTLDTHDGTAWIGVVPFRMEDTRHRLAPRIPTAHTFPEVNVRTYVRGGDRAGVWFLSLDAASILAVWGARLGLNLPYHHASMEMRTVNDEVHYLSRRRSGSSRDAVFRGSYRPIGEVYPAAPGTLDHWLTERYCLFGTRRSGSVYVIDVHHAPWPLQHGTATIEHETLLAASGVVPDRGIDPMIHVSRGVDVWAWSPVAP